MNIDTKQESLYYLRGGETGHHSKAYDKASDGSTTGIDSAEINLDMYKTPIKEQSSLSGLSGKKQELIDSIPKEYQAAALELAQIQASELLEKMMDQKLENFKKEMTATLVPNAVSKQLNTMATKLGMKPQSAKPIRTLPGTKIDISKKIQPKGRNQHTPD